MPRSVISLLALILFSYPLLARSPSCRLDLGKCAWYKSCLESKVKCGPEGYPLGFAKYYCDKFGKKDFVSPATDKWLDNVRLCLQRSLKHVLWGESVNCPQVADLGFGSHSDCYIAESDHSPADAPSICFLPIKDLTTIIRTIEGKAWRHPSIQGQFATVARRCVWKIGRNKDLDQDTEDNNRLEFWLSILNRSNEASSH